jgi:hypothetical protein
MSKVRRLGSAFFVLFLSLAAAFVGPSPARAAVTSIVAATTGNCLNPSGTYVYVDPCRGLRSQQWDLRWDANSLAYRIVNEDSGKCLDHSDWGTGRWAIVWTCNGAANQAWILTLEYMTDRYTGGEYRLYRFTNLKSGLCLDQTSFGAVPEIQLYARVGWTSQGWTI